MCYSQNPYWDYVNENAVTKMNTGRVVQPQSYKALSLDFTAYKNYLQRAPKEFSTPIRNGMTIGIPYPDNSFQRFTIVETRVMEESLAA